MGQALLYSLIDKAIFDYKLIEDNDNILVGASAGKDSTALIEYFSLRKKRKNANFNFTALHIVSEFGEPFPEEIAKLMKDWQVNLVSVNVNIQARLKEGRKMSCYWCSTQRRKELLDYALANGFNKIALGHHLDDILETLLMNMLFKSELSTMPPILRYDNYPVTIIRPLCYVSVDTIIEHAKKEGYYGHTCTCNFQDNSTRKDARKRLELLTDGNQKLKEHLFASLKNIYPDYLP